MANGDWHENFMWGAVLMLFTAIYGGVIKHIWGHVQKDDIVRNAEAIKDHTDKTDAELKNLKDNVQWHDNCSEIVKRQDGMHKTTQDMVKLVYDKLEKIEAKL